MAFNSGVKFVILEAPTGFGLAIVAFVLLTLGLLGLYIYLQETMKVKRNVIQALVLSWIGVGLTLPYYGADHSRQQ